MGVVLGSIPIAIESDESIGSVFEVISAFMQYSREVFILDAKLGPKCTIFCNDAVNPLTTITEGREIVLEVATRPNSGISKSCITMAPVYKNRIDALKVSSKSCALTVDRIRNRRLVLCLTSGLR